MVDVSWISDAIRFPFILFMVMFDFVIVNLVPIIIVVLFVLFLNWFFVSGVRDRIVKLIVELKEKKKCHLLI